MVRAWAIARQKALNEALAEDDPTPLALLGELLLWVLRLTVAPTSTLAGFRAWVLEECPVAPGRRLGPDAAAARATVAPFRSKAISAGARSRQSRGGPRDGTKTARFLGLVSDRFGPLEVFPLADVSRVASELAPEADLNPGAARASLRRHVLALRKGSPQ